MSEWKEYPAESQLHQVLGAACDALVVDVDADNRIALDLVEAIEMNCR